MNPDESIRIWLLTAGEQFGIEQAHDYQWDDASTRPQEPYFTYFLDETVPFQSGRQENLSSSGNDASVKVLKDYTTTVRIDLHRDKAGLHHLAAIAAAGEANPFIRQILKDKGCELTKTVMIKNLTPRDLPEGEREEHYHHYMVCLFDEMISHTMTETNAVVDRVRLQLFEGGPTFDITEDGIFNNFVLAAGSGDLVATGSAVLTKA